MKIDTIISQQHQPKPVILVFGKLCAGKGTYCAPFVHDYGYHHISTSSVVKQVSGQFTRDKLQDTGSMHQAIAGELIDQMQQHDKVIVDGIRQPQIVQAVLDHFGHNNVDMVWLNVPDDVRRERYLPRGDAKDTQSFDDADAGDQQLGLKDVERQYRSKMINVDNY